MTVRLGINIAALQGIRRLDQATNSLGSVYERLSSGQRINRASDDAAGLAIASSLEADRRIFNQAIRNVNDGISLVNIAEGALSELGNVTIRQKELAEQSANGVYTLAQRRALDEESFALQSEFNRIVDTAEFNGISIFGGDAGVVNIEAGYGASGSLTIGGTADLNRTVGTGEYSFAAATLSRLGGIAADFNGDGNVDVVASHAGGAYTRVSFGNGDGTFQAASQIANSGHSSEIAVSDHDNDGDMDIAVARYYSADLMLLENDGAGNFTQSTVNLAAGGLNRNRSVFSHDLNQDGYTDMVVSDVHSTGNAPIEIYLNDKSGNFSLASTVAGGNDYSSSIAFGDIDNDGDIDLATNGHMLLNDGFANFTVGGVVNTPNTWEAGDSLIDLNHDGNLDYVISQGAAGAGRDYISYNLGNGDGTFSDYTQVFSNNAGTRMQRSRVLDINNDGYDDIAFHDYQNGLIETFLSDGKGSLTAGFSITADSALPGMTIGDFNNDGVTDLATATGVNLALTEQSASVQRLNLLTQENSREALDTLDVQLERITAALGALGADASRMQVATNTLAVQSNNYFAARSRIVDADIAEESSRSVRLSILRDAASTVLAQANQQPALALRLLA